MKSLLASFLSLLSIASTAISASNSSLAQCSGYTASNIQQTYSSITADLILSGSACNVYGTDLMNLKFLAEYQTDSRIHVIIYDAEQQVYQVPETVVQRPGGSAAANDSLLEVDIVEKPFSFSVSRKDTKEVIFNTSTSNLIFESQYLGFRTSLPTNPALYGLGEHTDALMLPNTNYVRTMWNRDAGGVPQGTNLYGAHPVYYEYRSQSNATHGVAFMNSNGMDIKINQDSVSGQYLEYNVLGGVVDFYFLAGPEPLDVARQYSEVTQKAVMMPYWGFGFHQCRFGYSGVDEVAEVVANYSKANIPLETMWTDIDYMDHYKVFTTDPTDFPLDKMRALVDSLHVNHQHYVLMVDPAVAYQDYDAFNKGVEAGVFMKTDNGSVYKAVVWPGVAAYPDWFDPGTKDYWTSEFQSFFSPDTGVDIDALWIDMNEPSNFCNWPCNDPGSSDAVEQSTSRQNGSQILLQRHNAVKTKRQDTNGTKMGLPGRNLVDPPYKINNAAGSLSNKTANTTLIHSGGWAEYDVHNLYGTMMSRTSREAMLARRPTKRPMVITRSTFIGAGSYVGHWLGDNVSAWDQYIISIRHLLQFVSFFQLPMVGADVCGFIGNTTENLCARWTTLGAFYPFYRNHNTAGTIPQEAYRWPSVAEAARKAIDTRYRLLDYIYTAMYRQTKDGTPMLTPLWMNYPDDATARPIATEYFYGPSILVAPVVDQDSTSVSVYFPKDTFYDFHTLKPMNVSGSTVQLSNVNFTDIPVFIRGGSIIPLRVNSANTTTALRDIDFELWVAPASDNQAVGDLYLDDGESLEQEKVSEIAFKFHGSTLSMSGSFDYNGGNVTVQSVTILRSDGPQKLKLGWPLTGQASVNVSSLAPF